MDYNQRTQMIGSWLQQLLKRYTPPSGMDRDTLGEELNLIVSDINSHIPSQFEKVDIQTTLGKIDKHVRNYQASRSWPTIKTFIESTKKSVEEYVRNTSVAIAKTSTSISDPSTDIMVRRILNGDAIPDWILEPDSPYRNQLIEDGHLTEQDFNKYIAPTA